MGSLMDGVVPKRAATVLARADEFTVEREGLWVHIMCGEGAVRLTMPALVWYQLCAQSVYEEES